MSYTIEQKISIVKRAKAIQHTFFDRSLFKAIRYTIKHWK
jgi:hypothetical protein